VPIKKIFNVLYFHIFNKVLPIIITSILLHFFRLQHPLQRVYYLLNVYVNTNVVYFENKQFSHRNELIYILILPTEVKNNKILFNLRNSVIILLFLIDRAM